MFLRRTCRVLLFCAFSSIHLFAFAQQQEQAVAGESAAAEEMEQQATATADDTAAEQPADTVSADAESGGDETTAADETAQNPTSAAPEIDTADTGDAAEVASDTQAADTAEADSETDAASEVDENAPITDQVQDLKQQVLELNRDLFILEEELLFPASTQVAVFLSMDVGEFFQLDAVQLKLNDKVVANYLYTERQVDALHRGGVQRLHMANVKSGEHELVAVFTGRGPHGRDYRRGATYLFTKESEPKYIELQIVDSTATLQPEFVIEEWQ